MIQRIQTVYLIIGTIFILVAFIKIPFFHCEEVLNSIFILNNYQSICFFLLLSILTVFSFKNRTRQIKLVYLLSFFCTCIILYNLYNTFSHISYNLNYSTNVCAFNLFFLPFFLAGKISYYLAIRSIKRDNDLLDSIDRLR